MRWRSHRLQAAGEAAAGGARRWGPLGLAAVLGLGALGCDPASPPAELPEPTRGLILISLDTLRADRLGCYGHPGGTSPFLDQLAARGFLAEKAIVQYPSTLTSHMSIFTGLYPGEHGVLPPSSQLAPEIPTLPELLQRAGFRTAGFTEGGYMRGHFGFRRGFDRFRARDHRAGFAGDTRRTFRSGLAFLRQLPAGERFFLFLHTYAVHSPYDPAQAHRGRFWPDPPPPGAPPATGPALSRLNTLGEQLPAEVLRYLLALYDAEIRELDDELRRFFAGLEELGLGDQVTVVITSDHGEEFQEHGRLLHTQLYDETLHVPLIVVHPRSSGGVRYRPLVESVDLAPTLLEVAGLEAGGAMSGRSFARAIGGGDPPAPRAEAYSESADGVRSLYRRDGDALSHLLLFEPPPRHWFARLARIEAAAGLFTFEARTGGAARALEVSSDGRRLLATQVEPRWKSYSIAVPRATSLELRVPDCELQERSGGGSLCRGLQLAGVSLQRAELYDHGSDGDERRSLVSERPEEVRRLLHALRQRNHLPAAGSGEADLDPELRETLKSLGYLD